MNRYYLIDDRAVMQTLPIKMSVKPSNRWYGAFEIYDDVVQQHRAEPGDEVHVLVGGTFLVYDEDTVRVAGEVVFSGDTVEQRSRTLQAWLADNATEIPEFDALPVERYRS